MNNENDSEESKHRCKKFNPTWIHVCIVYVRDKIDKWNVVKKEESPQDRLSRRLTNATIAIAIFTSASVVVGGMTYCTLTGQQNVMEKQLKGEELDRRPYIWLTNDSDYIDWHYVESEKSAQVIWTTHYLNYGKSPAHNLITRAYIRVGKGPYQLSFGKYKESFGGEVPPGKNNFISIVSPLKEMSFTEEEELRSTDKAVGILLEFDYFDAEGKEYTDVVCMQTLASGAVAGTDPINCPKE